jgi:ABC-type polysaccharide/polyol phosphate transport system ATPase subunit
MIQVRDLHKSYPTRFGSKVVLEDVNFELAKGERLGILGRNGAGKSTMIRLVSGAERPTSGRIERTMSVSWPLAFGGAFQPQLTGIDNIRFITKIYDQDFDQNLAFVEDFAELGAYLREPVRSYSSGMRARLAFAISMIIEFDCFLIDEIGAVGDARFHDRCNYELFEMRRDRAMIIISHDAGYLRDHCNRWAILHEGKLSQFNDFELAYSTYKELIDADTRARPVPVNFTNRAWTIDSTQRAALTDERFRALVQQGDWARDQREWSRAGEEYKNALAMYPFQRSYWTQLGHMEKEMGEFAKAEIAYRTAVALGEPLADVEQHAQFVIERQGDLDTAPPIRLPVPGAAANQPPSRPDFDVLTWLMCNKADHTDSAVLHQLRHNETLDALGVDMVTDPAFVPLRRSEDRSMPGSEFDVQVDQVCALVGAVLSKASRTELVENTAGHIDLVDVFLSANAFADWPLTRAALAFRYPQHGAPTHGRPNDHRIN